MRGGSIKRASSSLWEDGRCALSARPVEVFLGDLMAGLTSLRLRQSRSALRRCYRLCWIPQQLWQRLEANVDDSLCFDAMQSVSDREPWHALELLQQGCVPCLAYLSHSLSHRILSGASWSLTHRSPDKL